MKYIEQTLNIGAARPFSFLHVSDTHLTYADERDGERKVRLAENRSKIFPDAPQNLADTVLKAKELDCFVAHTGDLIDFVSQKNLEEAKAFTDAVDCFMAAGNHEFSLYVGEAKEDAEYRNQSLDKVQSVFKNDIRFSSRKINGINLISVDNSYYLFEQWQTDRLKQELELSMPTILFLHTPLYSAETYDFCTKDGTELPAYLMSVPDEKMKRYSPDRYEQQKQDEITREAFELITNSKNIKAIFAGHLHKDFEACLTPTIMQFVTGIGTGRIVTIK
ncbi:MAG: metallophosphoesterase [Clostridia bacterium]|nr:metallophosphoesterase [Clostridia bacterium]